MQATIMIVDDDDTFRFVLARGLRQRGYEVIEARSAEEAWQLAQEDPPEFALIDLKMQGASGLVLVRQLASLQASIKMVVLTGYASISTAVEAIKLGAMHYLAKPVELSEIIQAFQKGPGDADMPIASAPLSVDRLEWEHIQRVLAEHQGNISATARSLKMHRRTLQRKLGKHPSR